MTRTEIRKFNRQIVGYFETDSSGNKTVKDFYGRILGYYEKARNATLTFDRRIIAYGDVTGVFFKDQISF